MFIVTTALLGFVVYLCDPTNSALVLLLAVSLMGYGITFIYFANYLKKPHERFRIKKSQKFWA